MGKRGKAYGIHDNRNPIVQSECRTAVTASPLAFFGKGNMVYSSAYRRSYKEPSWDDYSKKEYISKVQYRSDRRSVEHRHEPWSWDSESEEEDIEEIPADDGSYDGGRRRRERVPREERIIDKRIPKQAWGEEIKEIENHEHAGDKALVLPEKLNYGEEEEKEPKHFADDVSRPKERGRGKRDNRKQHRSADEKRKHRSQSASPEKNRYSRGKKNKVPFLPYGMANEGPVEKWKTHNVLASQQEVSKQSR